MAIFDILNLPWFQNLVWRLREHDHFSRIHFLERWLTDRIEALKNYSATALPSMDATAPVRAATRADLLNNIRRLGGWDQQTALACICTDE